MEKKKNIAFQNNCQPCQRRSARGIVTFYVVLAYQHHIHPFRIYACMLVYAIRFCVNCVCMLGNRHGCGCWCASLQQQLDAVSLHGSYPCLPVENLASHFIVLLSCTLHIQLCNAQCASTKAYASVLKFIKTMAHVADVQKKP